MITIKQLQDDVVSVNNVLREKVHEMDTIELLRNCHPFNRSKYAYELLREGVLSEIEAKEFTQTIGTKK